MGVADLLLIGFATALLVALTYAAVVVLPRRSRASRRLRDKRFNERLKLMATAVNALSVATVAGSVLLPSLNDREPISSFGV